jgi:IclR family transcriptional regulator, acetate operon repressor
MATPLVASDGTAALDKALDVLDAVANARTGMSQAELSQALGLPRTTMYRLLGTLVGRGLVRRDPLRRVYSLGTRCFEYARNAYAMPDLVAAASTELRALRDMTGETTYLATLDGIEVVSLERCDGAHSHRSHAAVGQRKPLHCTSQGKAILAAMPPEQRDAIVRELHLTALTPRSITERRRLSAELRLTATRGWSIDDEEIVLGVRCCGAAIVDKLGQVRGAISVAAPAFRMTVERIELLGPEVAEAARRIGAQISAAPAQRLQGEPRVVAGDWAFEGAAPCWWPQGNALLWADRLAPAVHIANAQDDRILAALDTPIQHLLAHPAGAAVCAGSSWALIDAQGRTQALAGMPTQPMTALCQAGAGQLWACFADAAADDRADSRADHRADPPRWRIAEYSADGQWRGGWRLAEPATAMAWSADAQTLYIACAGSGSLFAARLGSSALQRLATVPKGSGQLSGLVVDRQGGVWTALRGGWSVARFDPDGSLDRVVALPVASPSGLALGGGDLYITSSRDAVSREALDAAPLSGRLFVIEQIDLQQETA